MRAYFAFVVPAAFGFCCTGSLAQTPTPDVVETVAHIGDVSVPLRITRVPLSTNLAHDFNDDQKSGGFFAPLAAAARAGNDLAAQYLWESLMRCSFVARTPAEQRAKLDEVKDYYARTGGHGETLEQDLESVQSFFRRCEGITDSSFVEARALLRDAADHGNARAELEYAQAIALDHPKEARRRFGALWKEGHLAALKGLAVQSLAHRIAFDAAMIAGSNSSGPGAVVQARADHSFVIVEPFVEAQAAYADFVTLRNETSPSTYNEAAKKAAEILRNPKCCVWP